MRVTPSGFTPQSMGQPVGWGTRSAPQWLGTMLGSTGIKVVGCQELTALLSCTCSIAETLWQCAGRDLV